MIKLFQKRTNVEVEDVFNYEYFNQLCNEKKILENRINMMSNKDIEVAELMEDRLRVVDKEINLIITQEKEARGEHTHGMNPEFIIVAGRKTPNPDRREILKKKAEDRRPIFVGGEML